MASIVPTSGGPQSEAVEEIIRRFDTLKADRSTLDAHLDEVARQVVPSFSGAFTSDSWLNPGAKRTQHLFDSTALTALGRFAAAMESMLTPRNQKWHKIISMDRVLQRNRQVQLWNEEVTDILFRHRYAPKANFANNAQNVWRQLGAFGTAVKFIDEDAIERGLRYRIIDLPSVYLAENHQGVVDTVFRKLTGITARQAKQKWPNARLEAAEAFLTAGKLDTPLEIIHCVFPREEYDSAAIVGDKMKYASMYIELSKKEVLQVGGYSTFPFAISRYVTFMNEVYGRSPAMEALPSIKTLNLQKKNYLEYGHSLVHPAILVHDDGVLDSASFKPGHIVAGGVTADGRPLAMPMSANPGSLQQGEKMMELERQTINDAFLVTLFQILVETPRMTATEVLERIREKGALLSPTMGRQQSEFLGPLIERELDVLNRLQLLPPMPPILIEAMGEYDIVYDSPLSRAQRAEEGAGALRTVQWAAEVAAQSQSPEPLDHFNWDVMIPELADINSMPSRWLRDPQQVAMIRQSRQQAMQMQQMIEAAPAVADVAKAVKPE